MNITERNASKLLELATLIENVKNKLPDSFYCNIINPVKYGLKKSKKESSSIYGSYKKYFSNANNYLSEISKYLSDVITVLEGQSSGINNIDKETAIKTEKNVLDKVNTGSVITKSLLKGSFATSDTGAVNTSSSSTSILYMSHNVKSNKKRRLPSFNSQGFLVRKKSGSAQKVINGLFKAGVVNAKHPASLDAAIDKLSPEECVWVLSKIENEGFGQTEDGYNHKSVKSDRNFYNRQVVKRYNGDIHKLLKKWGTYKYTGY